MIKHTPPPYRVDHRATTRVVAGEDDTVATTGCQGSLREDWEGNAEFIARACTNYSFLIEALENMIFLAEIADDKMAYPTVAAAKYILKEARS